VFLACNRLIVEPVSLLSRRLPAFRTKWCRFAITDTFQGHALCQFRFSKGLNGAAFGSYDLTACESLS